SIRASHDGRRLLVYVGALVRALPSLPRRRGAGRADRSAGHGAADRARSRLGSIATAHASARRLPVFAHPAVCPAGTGRPRLGPADRGIDQGRRRGGRDQPPAAGSSGLGALRTPSPRLPAPAWRWITAACLIPKSASSCCASSCAASSPTITTATPM